MNAFRRPPRKAEFRGFSPTFGFRILDDFGLACYYFLCNFYPVG